MLKTTITIIALLSSLDGGIARLEDDATGALLRAGDTAILYRITADHAAAGGHLRGHQRWNEVAQGALVARGDDLVVAIEPADALAAADTALIRAAFTIPSSRLTGTVSQLDAAADDSALIAAAEALIPGDERVELAVLRLLERRWAARNERTPLADEHGARAVITGTDVDPVAEPAPRQRTARAAGTEPPTSPSPGRAPAADTMPATTPGVFQAETTSAGATEAPPPVGITDRVRGWAQAWSEQRVDDYLTYYSNRFVPAHGSRNGWEAERRQRLEAPAFIAVDLDDLDVRVIGANRAETTFVQRYRSDTFEDTVTKRLIWVWENESWRIESETEI